MFGALFLLAASVSPVGTPSAAPPKVGPSLRAHATATATIRIVTGVRFGPEQLSGGVGAHRRKAQIREADGVVRPAELLEFQ